MIFASREQAEPSRHYMSAAHSDPFYHTNYIGRGGGERVAASTSRIEETSLGKGESPTAFLIELGEGAVVQAHYHAVDQFQVIVDGNGSLGGHPLDWLNVHYTNAHTPYGPILCGKTGLHYLTLRNGIDPGARKMPDSRLELRAVAGREHRETFGGPLPRLAEDKVKELGRAICDTIIEKGADGLGAWLHRLPPGASLEGPMPAEGNGQYWIVLSGSMQTASTGMANPYSCFFVYPDEKLQVAAGPEGAQILILQFPKRGTH